MTFHTLSNTTSSGPALGSGDVPEIDSAGQAISTTASAAARKFVNNGGTEIATTLGSGAIEMPMAGAGATRPDASEKLRAFSDALRRGETQAALEAARDACLAEPNRAEAHYAYGQAWMAAGKPARAEQAFAIAAKLRPSFADAWVNLGLARYAQGAVYDAKERHGPRPAGAARPSRGDEQSRGAVCASPAVMRRPKRCCARRWRATRSTPARG